MNPVEDDAGLPAASLPVLLSRILVLIALGAQIFVAWRYWATTWDDSAITLGFARTFAQTGRIEPTPGSGIVEGYSTSLWMLLMAAAAKVATTPASLLITAKLASLGLNLANILLMRRWFASWPASSETLGNLVAASVGCGFLFAETINGMETPLILTLVLAMLLLRVVSTRGAREAYLVLGVALLLTRWEAAWLLVPFVLVEGSVRRALPSSLLWLSAWLATELARWGYFGSLLPNTVLAKRGAPYSPPSLRLQIERHLQEPLDVLLAVKMLIVAGLLALLLERWLSPRPRLPFNGLRACWQLRFTCLFVFFSFVLTTAIGPNWGPPLRSFFAAWPFLIAMLLLPIAVSSMARIRLWGTVAVGLLALLHLRNQISEFAAPDPPFYMQGLTVANVRLMSDVIADLEAASHRQDLLFAGPDMGGIMLYGKHVRVLDLGLLCDPVLARRRYSAFDDYVLQTRRPDVIEVHQRWITLTGVEHLQRFREGYLPVFVEGMRVFVSRDLLASIDPGHLTEKAFDASGKPASGDTAHLDYMAYKEPDYELDREFGRYFVLH